ncbi:MAG: TIGR00266 family protein [Flexibacter sp. CG_4_10_14_3_um_filter_32_15]|nr:MAG: TIGR00266 family protein [Flexibacter sp. CG_4_10_14_3_um_filter_32_15]
MKSHEIDYKIIGNDIQIVEVDLDPNETVIAEAGAMLYMEENIHFETKMGDGSEPKQGIFGKLMSAGARMITGESLFMTHFTQRGSGKGKVAFAAPYPGTVTPVQLASCNNNTLIVQKDSFLCAALGAKISVHLNKRFGSGFFGGEGFIMQKLQGDGMVFFHAGGTVIEKELKGGTLKVDTGCIVAFEEGITMDIQKAGDLKSMFFGGEGLFLATLSGTGKVWLQSMPLSKLVQALSPMSKAASKATSLGGILGGD